MSFEVWFLVIGGLLITIALLSSMLKHLPITTTIIYLIFGLIIGPVGFSLFSIDPFKNTAFLERVTEIAVLISLFTTGMKLRIPLNDRIWWLPVRLASISMIVKVALVTALGFFLLKLPLGASVLLGAILAPTDPVLASDVQVEHPGDRDRLRFMLSGEAGLNDGTAFPFVMLGLGLMGLHELGDFGLRWLGIDVVWAVIGGLGIGALLGWMVGKIVLYLRQKHKEAFGLDEFLTIGLIGLSYGAALLLKTYGFLAVFAAGFALRQLELSMAKGKNSEDITVVEGKEETKEEIATDSETAPQYLAGAVLGFNEQLERLFEIIMVLLVAGMFTWHHFSFKTLWFVPVLFLFIRPICVLIGTAFSSAKKNERYLAGWFGIRGIGSLYYLMYAIQHGIPRDIAEILVSITLSVVITSILVHGISVTPLMKIYNTRRNRNVSVT
ncbi:MAG: cation:proton antiporter [Bacteroidota bacterium]